jgi:hypothetical protein
MKSIPFATLLSSLALAAVSAAQVQGALSTAADLGVAANRQTDQAAGGTPIAMPLSLAALDGRNASARSIASPADGRNGGGASASFTWSGFAAPGNVAGTLGGSPLALGPQAYTLDLSARSDTPGRLVLSFSGAVQNGRAGATVRVGSETRSFSADGSRQSGEIAVTVGTAGVAVAIEISGIADATATRTSAASHANLSVQFVADGGGGGGTCTLQRHQPSCPEGGTLNGQVVDGRAGRTLDLDLSGALANAIGVTVLSLAGDTFPVPGTNGCIFFAQPLVYSRTFTTDGSGNAMTSLPLPIRDGRQLWLLQATVAITPRGFTIGTSNSLQVACE